MANARDATSAESAAARTTVSDTAKVAALVAMPTLAGGVIKRRPRAMGLAEKYQFDRPAIRLVQQLRTRYSAAPLRLRVPGRSIALVLSPEDVETLLEHSPEPFSPASYEKKAALGHFQPHGVLVSTGSARAHRRHFTEAVLDTHQPLHRLAGTATNIVSEEATRLVDRIAADGEVTWASFNVAWWRMVRRIVLGDTARDDHTITDMLAVLRRNANWAYLGVRRTSMRAKFTRRLDEYLQQADPASLAGLIAEAPAGPQARPHDQVPHWLFAFDAAGIVTLRTLALLASHPEQASNVRNELSEQDSGNGDGEYFSYLQACLLESVRLWPTTPALLRESTTQTRLSEQTFPGGTEFLIFTPFFHRDARTLDYADAFTPDIWLDGRASQQPALVPFSAGPAGCPGRNLVLFLASTFLAALLRRYQFRIGSSTLLTSQRRLPATLDNFSLRLPATEV